MKVMEKETQITSAPRSLKFKNWAPIGTAALLVVSVGTTICLAYQNYQLKQQIQKIQSEAPTPVSKATPTPISTPTPTLAPTPTPDITANWKTYTNTEEGFSFKHPENLSPDEKEDIVILFLWGPTQKPDTEFYDGISLQFNFPFKLENKSLESYVDSAITESKQTSEIIKAKEKIVINGLNGYTYTERGLGDFQSIFLESSGSVDGIEIVNATRDPTGQGFQQTVDQVLSTFKFIP